MREKEIEKKLTQMVKQAGGICPKLVSPAPMVCPTAWCFFREAALGLWR